MVLVLASPRVARRANTAHGESTAMVDDARVDVQTRGNADHTTIWQAEQTAPTRE
ncbi:hypothetical protein ABZY45_34850 [Streptomyces sp. NPDC006516]|uniref:hypothetical protein n=1 Tax=Streptomyces sp. NPDC006516 TaxID=3154309 RepID=UPI0033A94C24